MHVRLHTTGCLASRLLIVLAGAVWLAACSVAPPRTDDPLQSFNRKMYSFNQKMDKAVIRPTAVGYRKVTNPQVRGAVSNFFTNLKLPVTIGNDLLQGKPGRAAEATGRFLLNLTFGLGGLLDPASDAGLPLHETDFGITLARWGVPSGPYLVLPLLGPATPRSLASIPAGYVLDPLTRYTWRHNLHYHAELVPQFLYLVNLRSSAFEAESFLKSAYDPYAFRRDAWHQRRIYKIYYGHPPVKVIQKMEGLDKDDFDPMQLLQEQEQWEQQQAANGAHSAPAHASSTSGHQDPA